VWAKQYGIVDEGLKGTKRITMYADDKGDFKGDALVVYLKKDSVDLAIRMGDDYWFRATNVDHHINVKEADTSFKRHQDGQEVKFVRKDKKANEATRARLMG
jgi:HIV Tat-specific factor 1